MTRALTALPLLLLLTSSPCSAMPFASAHSASVKARPLPDLNLPVGVVSILAIRAGRPVPGAEVLLLPSAAWPGTGSPDASKALLTGRTNDKGRLFLKAESFSDRSVRLAVRLAKVHRASVAFRVPSRGGVRFLFTAGGAPHGGGASPGSALPAGHPRVGQSGRPVVSGPTTTDPHGIRIWVGFQVMFIEGGEVYLALLYQVTNVGRDTFVPGSHGLLLPAPAGAHHVAVPREIRTARQDDKGVRLVVPVPPGERGVRARATCRLRYEDASLPIRLLSALPIVGYAVSMQKYQGVRVQGPALSLSEGGHAHPATPERVQRYRSSNQGFPRKDLSFSIVGLPVRSRARSWPFAILALLLALGGLVFSVVSSRRSARGGRRARTPPTPPAEPTEEAIARERDRLLGLDEP